MTSITKISRKIPSTHFGAPRNASAAGVFFCPISWHARKMKKINRAAFYFDGFNFYHAIDDLNKPHLKWMNLWRLGKTLASSRGDTIVKAEYFSAFREDIPEKVGRHREYLKAIEAFGVITNLGHFSKEPKTCNRCQETWKHPTEKETDINLAIKAITDAIDDLYDVAYIVTTDGDQKPTCRILQERFQKKVVTVATPGRRHNMDLMNICGGDANAASFSTQMLESNVMTASVIIPGGFARRPAEYDKK